MLSVYYALFYSHMNYGSLVWSLTTQKSLGSVFRLQKKSIRIINFATFNQHTNPLLLDDRIIKFPDVIKLNQLMLVQQFNNKILPRELENLMEHIANIHTRSSSNSGLFIPQISSTNFGSYSHKYMAPYVWNNFSRVHPDISNYNNCKSLKNFLIKYFLELYNCQ